MKQPTRIEWVALNNEAVSLHEHGHYDRAVVVAKKALKIAEQALGPDHPDVAAILNNLAELYKTQGHYAQAEPLYKRSLAIGEKTLGLEHPEVAKSLSSLAELYRAQGHHAQAEPLHQRSQAIESRWRERNNVALDHAAASGDVPLVRSLLASGADPSYRDEEETPLHEAVIYGHAGRMKVAELLIKEEWGDAGSMTTGQNGRSMDCYVDADSDFGTPLGIAVDNDDIRMVRFLLDHNAHPDADGCSGGTSLHRTAKSGNVRILRLLLGHMAQEMYQSSFGEEVVDVTSNFFDNQDTTPLHVAAEAGQLGAVNLLLAAGANVNAADAEGETPLYKAACRGHGTMVECLLEAGAAVEGTKDKSPLAAAAAAGARNVVTMLLKAGASLKATSDGSTALSLARSHHHKAVVNLIQKFQAGARAKGKKRAKKSRSAK